MINFPLNEAIAITDEDYIKFKRELDAKNRNRTEDYFQKTFQELWPNAYNLLNNKKPSSSVLSQQLKNDNQSDKNRYICRSCHQICHHESPLFRIHAYEHDVTHSNTYLSPSTPSKWIDKTTYQPRFGSSCNLPNLAPKKNEKSVELSFSEDTNSSSVSLLLSIKDNNEKLRFRNEIYKSKDLIDDIINRVNVLQDVFEKKSNDTKINDYNRSKSRLCSQFDRSSSPNYSLESLKSKTPTYNYFAYKQEPVSEWDSVKTCYCHKN